jgi:hypothetical protein
LKDERERRRLTILLPMSQPEGSIAGAEDARMAAIAQAFERPP